MWIMEKTSFPLTSCIWWLDLCVWSRCSPIILLHYSVSCLFCFYHKTLSDHCTWESNVNRHPPTDSHTAISAQHMHSKASLTDMAWQMCCPFTSFIALQQAWQVFFQSQTEWVSDSVSSVLFCFNTSPVLFYFILSDCRRRRIEKSRSQWPVTQTFVIITWTQYPDVVHTNLKTGPETNSKSQWHSSEMVFITHNGVRNGHMNLSKLHF